MNRLLEAMVYKDLCEEAPGHNYEGGESEAEAGHVRVIILAR